MATMFRGIINKTAKQIRLPRRAMGASAGPGAAPHFHVSPYVFLLFIIYLFFWLETLHII